MQDCGGPQPSNKVGQNIARPFKEHNVATCFWTEQNKCNHAPNHFDEFVWLTQEIMFQVQYSFEIDTVNQNWDFNSEIVVYSQQYVWKNANLLL